LALLLPLSHFYGQYFCSFSATMGYAGVGGCIWPYIMSSTSTNGFAQDTYATRSVCPSTTNDGKNRRRGSSGVIIFTTTTKGRTK